MELLINLSKDIDGKEFNIIKNTDTQETSKIQKVLERMENNFNVNKHINDEDDEQTIDNNDNNNFDDIDGEPL
jgi:tyrosyl-tRNA synthetase